MPASRLRARRQFSCAAIGLMSLASMTVASPLAQGSSLCPTPQVERGVPSCLNLPVATMLQLASAAYDSGRYGEAQLEAQCLLSFKAAPEQQGLRVEAMQILGRAATHTGQFPLADTALHEALADSANDDSAAGKVHIFLGDLHERQKLHDQARSDYAAALKLLTNETRDWRDIVTARFQIGDIEIATGHFDKGIEAYSEALKMAAPRHTDDPALARLRALARANAHDYLGYANRKLGDFDAALQHHGYPTKNFAMARAYFDSAIKEFGDVHARDELVTTYVAIGHMHEMGGKVDDARRSYLAAIEIVEEIRGDVVGEDNRITLFARRQAPYDALINLLLSPGGHPSAAAKEEALRISECARSRTLVDHLTSSAQASSGPANSSGSRPTKVSVARCVTRQAVPARSRESLAPGDVALEYYIGATESYLFVVRPGRAAEEVPLNVTRAQIAADVQSFRLPFEGSHLRGLIFDSRIEVGPNTAELGL